jgi:hypothetical protein
VNVALRPRPALGLVLLVMALISLGAACRSPGAAPLESGDAANGVTIDNPTGMTVKVVYEAPDGGTEPLAELAPGGHIVIDSIFAGRDGLCRTGRLVALDANGAELDELYLVCRDRTWVIEVS